MTDGRRAHPDSEGSWGGISLQGYWDILRRRKWTALVVATGVLIAVMVGTLLQTPVYRATGMLEFRKQGAEVVPVEAMFQTERISQEYLETQYGILRSRALAERVVDELGLDRDPRFGAALRGETEEGLEVSPEAVRSRLVDRVRAGLDVDPVEGSRLVRVAFESPDPQLAADIVNSVFRNYVQIRVEAGRGAVDRLSAQVDSVEIALRQSAEQLRAYAREAGLPLADGGPDAAENLSTERISHLQQLLTDAEGELYQKEALYDMIRSGERGILNSDLLRQLSLRIAEVRGEYARLSSGYGEDHPRAREVERQLAQLEAEYGRAREWMAQEAIGQYEALRWRQRRLADALAAQKRVVDTLAVRSVEYEILRRDVEAQEQLFAMLQQKRKEAGISAALAGTDVGVIDLAVPPREPDRPSPRRNLSLALMASVILGVGASFVREYTDTSFKSVKDLRESLTDVPVLAMIPSMRVDRGKRRAGTAREARRRWHRIDATSAQGSALADAFGQLRTSVLLNGEGEPPRTLLVTSSQAGEGKTTVAVNLAISLARLDHHVLLVDADIRRPSLHGAFGIEAGPGLTEALMGEASWLTLVRPDVFPGLDVLPSGLRPSSPTEVLSSRLMEELTREAEEQYDFVLLDAPALFINAADSRILTRLVGGVIFVVRSGVTPRNTAFQVIRETPKVMGVVLNDADVSELPGYYGSNSEEGKDSKPGRRAFSGAS